MLAVGDGDIRVKLEGRLGGATYLRTMAEILRRAMEEVQNEKLREEDQLGFGWAPPYAKLNSYGTNRLLDGRSCGHH